MHLVRPGPRAFHEICRTCRKNGINGLKRSSQRRISSQTQRSLDRSSKPIWTRPLGAFLTVGIGAAILIGSKELSLKELRAESPPPPAEIQFEKSKKKKGLSKEDNRDLISSQHLQVKRSWENPGVYAWGSNTGKVAAPGSDEAFIKSPTRIPFFDGVLLRDIKLDRNFGVAVTEQGDLLQWGIGYSEETSQPTPTLKGKDLVSVTVSRDRVVALSSSGTVYSLSVARADQLSGPKPLESTWIPFYSSQSPISYRTIKPPTTSWSEKVSSISCGLDHLLLITSSGRIFSAAASSSEFPSRGQLGIPGLTWTTRPPGAYDQPHEITTLRGFEISSISAGDYHSLAVDKEGRVFAFGDNSLGQLGFDYSPESPTIDAPSLLPIQKLYVGTNQVPRVTSVAAGGVNSFFTIDATRVAGQGEDPAEARGLGRVTADTWSCGQGIYGGLGNGRWTHMQGTPTKIKKLSSLFEYDEGNRTVIPIRLQRLSVGSTHASATMDNVTHIGAHSGSSENDTNWGADVLWWGGNEHYQLGTGKRNNKSIPDYIAPLDLEADREKGRREEHRFQITPKGKVRIGGREVTMEQRVECGRFVSAIYSGV
ncbi:hypothetical protein MMC14_009857 [Varicellaria rhodocarpa]|nr:hypothetical protein [Varicellaria rhodocarpa]